MKAKRINLPIGLMFILMPIYQTAFPLELSAQLKFSIPELTAQPGESLNIPVEMTGAPTDSGIFSIQFDIIYNPILITADNVIFNTTSPVISDWKNEFNLTDGKISFALAGSDFVPTDIVIANLTFMVSEFAENGDMSELHFENLYVNEGTPAASGQDGIIRVVIIGVIDRLDSSIPKSPWLEQNFPNPFNPMTMIEFSVPRSGYVSLIIYNVGGAEVARLIDSEMSSGKFSVVWNASNMASGIYFYRLQAGDFIQSKKMLLLK